MQPTGFQKYAAAYNAHTYEFFNGLKEPADQLHRKRLSHEVEQDDEDEDDDEDDGAQPLGPKHREAAVETWSEEEKDIFFEFLGRYGIANVEKIQRKIKTKSVLQIMAFYDTLKEYTSYYKKKRRLFKRLVTYSEFPASLEVDEIAIAMEDEFSSKITSVTPDATYDDTNIDNEDELINFKSLTEVGKFVHSLPHLNVNPIKPKSIPLDIKNYLTQLTKEIITSFLQRLILEKTQIDSTLRLDVVPVDPNGNKSNDDYLMVVEMLETDPRRIIQLMGLKRTMFMRKYYEDISNRLDFEIIDYERTSFDKMRSDPHVYDAEHNRSIAHMVRRLVFDGPIASSRELGLFDRKLRDDDELEEKRIEILYGSKYRPTARALAYDSDDMGAQRNEARYSKAAEKLEETEEQTDQLHNDNVFIVDDIDEDELLDNDVAWFLLSLEAQDCDATDFQDYEMKQMRYLKHFGMDTFYHLVKQRLNSGKNVKNTDEMQYRRNNAHAGRIRDITLKNQRKIAEMTRQLETMEANPDIDEEEIEEHKRNLEIEKESVDLFQLKVQLYCLGVNKSRNGVETANDDEEEDGDITTKILNNDDSDYYSDLFLEELEEDEVSREYGNLNDDDDNDDHDDDNDEGEESDEEQEMFDAVEEIDNPLPQYRELDSDDDLYVPEARHEPKTDPKVSKRFEDHKRVFPYIDTSNSVVCKKIKVKNDLKLPGINRENNKLFELTPEMQLLFSYSHDDGKKK
jgi:hypothetical protein